jgi:hypothetical protein
MASPPDTEDPDAGLEPRPRQILWAAIVGVVLALGVWAYRQIQLDRCLDAGGRWNHQSSSCEGVHPDNP